MKLFFRESGEGTPLIILHGLFGSSDNWFTIAKTFAATHKVYLVDQRNHGQSPHSDAFDYKLLSEDVHEFVSENRIENAVILGHSMGGKAAMNFAVKYPGELSTLIVVDIVPKTYPVHHDKIVAGLKALVLNQLSSRNEADALLKAYVPDAAERQFLLKNLTRTPDGGFQWRMNLKSIDEHLEETGEGMQYPGTFDKRSLFVYGTKSRYFKSGDETLIKSIFTNAQFVPLNTGHWVQAEQPVEFANTVLGFLNQGA